MAEQGTYQKIHCPTHPLRTKAGFLCRQGRPSLANKFSCIDLCAHMETKVTNRKQNITSITEQLKNGKG